MIQKLQKWYSCNCFNIWNGWRKIEKKEIFSNPYSSHLDEKFDDIHSVCVTHNLILIFKWNSFKFQLFLMLLLFFTLKYF